MKGGDVKTGASDGLAARAQEIIAAAEAVVGAEVGQELSAVRRRLSDPLRVAVVGRVKAGKSTLVNALLGRHVAPTDVSECTQVVTEFRYGFPERAEVVLRDGTTMPLGLRRGGRLPDGLGVDLDRVGLLRVWLPNEVLKTMTLIDTPGLNSATTAISARSEEWLRDGVQVDGTDVVLFVINSSVNAAELAMLRDQYVTAVGSTASALTAIGVLTKADQLGGTGDPWTEASSLAATLSDRLESELAVVLPVFGLLAETTESFDLTETDAADLAALADLRGSAPATMLWGPDHFLSADLPIPVDRRVRLLERLDLHGIGLALELTGGGVCGATQLRDSLVARTGLSALRTAIEHTFSRRADVLKTAAALSRLDVLSYRGTSADVVPLARLRASVEDLRDDDDLHEVAELAALHQCLTGVVTLPCDLRADVLRMARTTTPADCVGLDKEASDSAIARASAGRASAWKSFANSGVGTREQAVARTLLRSYSLLFAAAQSAVRPSPS